MELTPPRPVRPIRQLSLFDAVCMMVGIIVGVGIYETSPVIAANLPSTGAVLGMWVLGGALSLCGAFCYAELASAYPDQGGDYLYLNRALGRWAGYLFAWGTFVIIRPGSIAAMAFPLARYGLAFCGVTESAAAVTLVAAAGVAVLTFMNCLRVKTGTRAQNVLTVLKVLGLGAVFAAAIFAPPYAGGAAPGDLTASGVGLALILVLFSYGGWQEIVYAAGEVRSPEQNLWRSILITVGTVSVIYTLVNLAFLHTLGHAGMAGSTAVAADVVAARYAGAGRAAIAALICISAAGAVNGLIFTGARVSYALGRDHAWFGFLARWDEGRGTPSTALLLQGVLSAAIVLICGSFNETVVYTSAVVWVFFGLTGACVPLLRRREPEVRRPFRVPGYPVTVWVFCFSALYLAYSAFVYDWRGSLVSILILLAGFLFYRPAAAASAGRLGKGSAGAAV